MRKLIVHCDNSKSVGTDQYLPLLVEDGTTEDEINEICWEMACDVAEAYFEIVDEYEEGMNWDQCISIDEIDYSYYDYIPEKHDMYRSGGGSFEDDFKVM